MDASEIPSKAEALDDSDWLWLRALRGTWRVQMPAGTVWLDTAIGSAAGQTLRAAVWAVRLRLTA